MLWKGFQRPKRLDFERFAAVLRFMECGGHRVEGGRQEMTFKDHFSGHADRYGAFRPTYPEALFDYLASGTRPGGSGGPLGALWRLFEWSWDSAWKLLFLAVVIATCWLAIWVTNRAQAPCCVMGPVLAICCYVIWVAPRAWTRSA